MRNQNYGGGNIPEPSLTPSSTVSPMTPTPAVPRLGPGDPMKTSPGLSSSPTPPTTSLLSLHPTNSALRAFGELYTVSYKFDFRIIIVSSETNSNSNCVFQFCPELVLILIHISGGLDSKFLPFSAEK